jgi:ABC-2 type transport system ATP-binding protein
MMIHIENLSVSNGARIVLHGVTLHLCAGNVYGLVGANGAGKSTLIRAIAGLVKPCEGRVRVDGRFGYVAQTFSLYPDLRVDENIEFYARCQGLPSQDVRAHVESAIDRLRLGGVCRERSGRLSHGWKQRVSLAAALVHRPEILLLDEATSGIDPDGRNDLWQLFDECRAAGMCVVLSTHHVDEIGRCDRVARLRDGALVA